jgi:hypothetical protein
MSYYIDNHYYQNVPSYDRSDIGLPEVGWGKSARAAGPAMVGVGVMKIKAGMVQKTLVDGSEPKAEASWFPWWGWMAVPLGLGGIALFAADQGWLGGKVQAITTGAKP